ncbi:MAG: CRISPR-associated helicase Cas3' [Peptococcia bacterium]
MYIAHVRESDKKKQYLRNHLLQTKRLAEYFGVKLKLKHVAGLAGLLHDIGKFSDEFQNYIKEVAFSEETVRNKRGSVDHSTAGGKLLFEMLHDEKNPLKKLLAEVVGNAIISHHTNLLDYLSPALESDYLRRVWVKEIPEYQVVVARFFQEVMTKVELGEYINAALDELGEFIRSKSNQSSTLGFFLSKYVFSCLIDGDRIDARMFDDGIQITELNQADLAYDAYYQKLMNHLNGLKEQDDANTPINKLRSAMSEECETFARKPSGIYTLSIPTGGGKTLASFRYALVHGREYNKQRIIYVVPYTTIIEQNAQEIRDILGDDKNILEHHSNVGDTDIEKGDEGDEQLDGLLTKREKFKLARDNWDSPIIFTTLVQFLNVFYAKGNSSVRRLHNLSHSVIIFDEVQKVPTKCISLFNEALNFLKEKASCSILLCTATQPTLEKVEYWLCKEPDGEIVPALSEVTKAFKRVEIVDKTEKPMNNEGLAQWIKENIALWGSTLVILNTKSVVKDLYEKLECGPVPVYHLSTSMCARHRKEQIKKIKKLLKKKIPFICVTTQLIEAGVNISFKRVIRSLSGLDSIAQAAGRCNRHGEDDLGFVYIINNQEEKLSKLQEIAIGKDITRNIINSYKKKPERYDYSLLSERAINEYFINFYKKMETDLNYYIRSVDTNMTKLLFAQVGGNSYVTQYYRKLGKRFPLELSGSYKTAAEHFQVIEQDTIPVIVPYEEGNELVAQLNSKERIQELRIFLRDAQQYTVDLYNSEFEELKRQGALVEHLEGMIYELKANWYSIYYGVDLLGEGEMELCMK